MYYSNPRTRSNTLSTKGFTTIEMVLAIVIFGIFIVGGIYQFNKISESRAKRISMEIAAWTEESPQFVRGDRRGFMQAVKNACGSSYQNLDCEMYFDDVHAAKYGILPNELSLLHARLSNVSGSESSNFPWYIF